MRWSLVTYSCVLLSPCLVVSGQDTPLEPNSTSQIRQEDVHVDPSVVQAAHFVDGTGGLLDTTEGEKKETQEKRDQVAEQIRLAERKVLQEQSQKEEATKHDEAKPAPPTISSDEETRLRLLKQVDVILAQLSQQASTFEDAKKELAERTQELQNVKQGQIGIEKPYSFLLLDQLQDELATLESNLSTSQLNQKLTEEDIVQAKLLVEQKEQALRQAKENKEIVIAPGAEDNSRFTLESRLANETLVYRKKRLEIQKLRAEVLAVQVEITKGKIEAIRDECQFSEEDLKNKQSEISKRENDVRRKLFRLEREMEYSDDKWLEDRKLISKEAQLTPLQTEEIELRRYDRQILQTRVSSLNFQLELLNQSRQAWDFRYQLANELTESEKEFEVEKTTIKNVQQRERDFSNRMLQLEELRKTIANLETKMASFADDESGRELRRIVELQKNAVRTTTMVLDEDIVAIQANRRVLEKLLADLQGDSGRYSLTSILESTWYYTKNIWNTELVAVDERSVTIGKIIQALAIFLGGFWIARFFSRRLRGFLTHRLKIDESAAAAFQSLAFYGLVLIFLLGALNFVSIPLTVFTFLGGALAIGVGFGSQNILSNFISGLILLAERPVKVGDLIQMDEFYGNIENIGARSTLVRTGTNLKLIVPNSKFLESNVINFTHGTNHTFRTHVSVGVAYGSTTREVTKLLKQAANDHGLVLESPEPFVLFKGFGDNSLEFELHFWIKVRRPLDRLKMESDLRYRIDSLFHEAGVVIAYPQRDVHVDSLGPIEIRLVDGHDFNRSSKGEAA